MGHATSKADKVSSAGDYEKFILPIVGDPKNVDIAEEAQNIATSAALDRSADVLRAQIGDCAYGVYVAGIITVERATEEASRVHTDPDQAARIARFGGLFVGAEVGLRLLQEESLDSAIQPMEIV